MSFTSVEKLKLFSEIVKNTNYAVVEDYATAEFINSNLMDTPSTHTIITDKYFITSMKFLLDTLVGATGSYFSKDFYDFRVKIFTNSFGAPSSTTVNDVCLDRLTNLKDTISDVEVCRTFLLQKVKDIINNECSLEIIQLTDDIIVLKKPNYVKCSLDSIEDILRNDPIKTEKLREIRQTNLDVTYNKDEVHSLYYNTDNDSFFYLMEDLAFNDITKHLTFCENYTTGSIKSSVNKFILKVTDEEFEDFTFMYKKFNKLSVRLLGSIDDSLLYIKI